MTDPADEHALVAALAADPTDDAAARALEMLYEDAGRFEDVVGLLIDRLAHLDGASQRKATYERAAELLEGRLDRPEAAFTVLLQAFGESADDGRFGRTLARLAAQCRTWDALFEVYETRLTEQPDADLHRRIAGWYAALDRDDDAARHWPAILYYEPGDEAVRRSWESWLESAERWSELVEALAYRLEREPDPESRRLLRLRLARVQEVRLGDLAGALTTLAEGYRETGDEAFEAAMERLAEASGEWAIYLQALAELVPQVATDAADLAERWVRVAEAYREHLGDADWAAAALERALAAEPDNARALAGLRTLLEESGRWDELAEILTREAEAEGDAEARCARYLALGDLYAEHLGSDADAVAAWLLAHEARPEDKRPLLRLLDVYPKTGRWEASVKVLRKLIKADADPAHRSRYWYAMGVIQRDELGDHLHAVRSFDQALDEDPTQIRAFQAIDEVLTRDADHVRQDRYYRKMLQRAMQYELDGGLIARLAANLGEFNRTRLGNRAAALRAYDIVLGLRPDDDATRAIVAELQTLEGRYAEAVATWRAVLSRQPESPEPYHQLARLFGKLGEADAAFCVCQALVVLGRASPEERHLFERGRGRIGAAAQRAIEDAEWRLLAWEGRAEVIDFALLRAFDLYAPLMANQPRDYGINLKRDQIDPQAPTPLNRVLGYVAQVIGTEVPTLWYAPQLGGLRPANLLPAALLVGPDVVSERPVEELAFLGARALYLCSRQHLIAAVDSDPATRTMRVAGTLSTLLAAVAPGTAVPHTDPGLLAALRGLPPGDAATLARALPALLSEPDLGAAAWLAAVEHTANRLGLLLTGDLATALRLIRAEAMPVGAARVESRIRALLAFAVSPGYLELRRRLGLGLRV